MTAQDSLVACYGDYVVFTSCDPDDAETPYVVFDGDMDVVDCFESELEARLEAARLDRAAKIEDLREDIQEILDEMDDSDDQQDLDRLNRAREILRPNED